MFVDADISTVQCENINLNITNQPTKKQKTTQLLPSLNQFVVRTTQADKHNLDIQVARFIYATNTAFRAVEHVEFVKLVNMLRPGYVPPTRQSISSELLNQVYDSLTILTKKELQGKTVCMALDGWMA